MTAAMYVQQQARLLGIPLTAQGVGADEINYVMFSSHVYDLAIVGWKVSAYPGYLCDWFGDGNPFHYDESQIKSTCEALNSTSDLDVARQQVNEIQSNLAQELPFIPLFSDLTYDAYRNVSYPFDHVLDGLSAVYGAPSLAIPVMP
jgi:ABC-type transport system substrate-binding protein